MTSGLLPSMNKSESFFCCVPPEVKASVKLVMPFREGVLPIRYIVIPLASKKITKVDCRVLIEVVQGKIGNWEK